jgi:GAF domain-containing protein
LLLFDGEGFFPAELHNTPSEYAQLFEKGPLIPGPNTGLGRLIASKEVIHIPDVMSGKLYSDGDPLRIATVDILQARTLLAVPMLKNAELVGAIIIYRQEPRPFSDKQVELVTNFASQAVIAIENTRLLRELRQRTEDLSESLQQQTATADVLQVINSSPGQLEPVFAAMLEKATHLCEAAFGILWLCDGEQFRAAALHGAPAAYAEIACKPMRPLPTNPLGRMLRGERLIVSTDVADEEPYRTGDPARLALVDLAGARSVIQVALLRDDMFLGSLTVYRKEVRPFSEKQIALLQNFAAQAVIAMDNARLLDELRQSLHQQTATADVLKVISRSTFDLQTVLDTLTESAARLCCADQGYLFRLHDERHHLAASFGLDPQSKQFMASNPFAVDRGTLSGRVALERRVVLIEDAASDPGYTWTEAQQRGNLRSGLGVPLISNDAVIGIFALYRTRLERFTESQIALVTTFADQAVIAIDNVRLFDEVQARTRDLQESLQQQTATADVLKVISRSAFDLDAVLATLVESARTLCDAPQGVIFLRHGDAYRISKQLGYPPEFEQYLRDNPVWADRGSGAGRAALTSQVAHIPDVLADPEYRLADLRQHGRYRAVLSVPLLRDGEVIGVFSLSRIEAVPFTERQIELVHTFADQAVIAIENTRLFNETKEALARQTATTEVLEVINSSPGNLEPVFDAMLKKAIRLCDAISGHFRTYDGRSFPLAAVRGEPEHVLAMQKRGPLVPGPHHPVSRFLRGDNIIHFPNAKQSEEYRADASFRSLVDRGALAVLSVALRKEGILLGYINVYRHVAESFTDRQIALLQNFASQAVIAMENARLVTETREALEQQTATADVLKVISRSAFDLQTVLDTLTQSAAQLANADMGSIARKDERGYYHATNYKFAVDWVKMVDPYRMQAGRDSVIGRALLAKKAVQIPDVLADADYNYPDMQKAAGYRTLLGVPMMRQGEAIGVLFLGRKAVEPFSDKQIELVSSFADQAVIAIENVRLFDEVQARTEELRESLQQQTATAEVLKIISRSAFDLQAVFDTLTTSAVDLLGVHSGTICVRAGDVFRYRSAAGAHWTEELWRYLQEHPVTPGRNTAAGRVILSGRIEQIADIFDDPDYAIPMKALTPGHTPRSILSVPLLGKHKVEGAMVLSRQDPGLFTEREVDILQTFADQAVIAIENARLFEEVQARTRELSQSLNDLRSAQDRLVQTEKLASLGQLTAGIAHEIKNPLNFVNNFSALSVELTDELNGLLKQAALAEHLRKDIDELTSLLKSNLEKIVQHGKRADSIVKNMLLHSREGSGELRAADVNGLVEESLNLAYHGARAEKSGFNITLQRAFDASAGSAELFPQEITRALLNLISNGFYAATRRKSENGEAGFEPTLSATTRNLGASIEIRIRDNGTGIPPEVKEKIFNPFFTTKPAGEGTGLGLSMTHDIIVKQHGGTIRVDTEPGAFTEFIVTLPRATAVQELRRSTK